MKGTLYLTYRIAAADVPTAMEVVPSHYTGNPVDDGVEYSVWFGDPVPDCAFEQAWSEIGGALEAAGVQFEHVGSGIAAGDPLPMWHVVVAGQREGIRVSAWSAEEAIAQIWDLFPPGTELEVLDESEQG